jgi:NitT/TauT family transport system substrate-binding protein
MMPTRRRFLAALSMAGAASAMGARSSFAAEPPPEVTAIRIAKVTSICIAPQYVAEELLRQEGFSDISYVATDAGLATARAVARGDTDISLNYTPPFIMAMDGGGPLTLLAGVMVGCFELFGGAQIRRIADLKGKSVGVQSLGSSPHIFLSIMASYVGLDPQRDIRWITSASPKPMDLFLDGKIDAFLGFPPEPQELRARQGLRSIVNSAADRPWSQYFCCSLAGHSDFVRKHPIATKRVLRAILKAADFCTTQPQRAARQIVDGGFTPNYDYALETITALPYDKWRSYDPEDTIRFYALRLTESGLIKSSPRQLIAEGTDWRFLNELKRELKA